MLALIFGVERFRTYIYGRSFTIKSDHKPLEPNLPEEPGRFHQPSCSTCYCASRAMITSSITGLVRKWPCLTSLLFQSISWPWHPTGHCHSPCSPVPRVEGSISTSLCEWSWDTCSCQHHHHQLARWHKAVPCPLHPYWQHCETLTIEDGFVLWRSPHCSSFRKVESTATTAPVPSRNHQSLVAHAWIHLLAWHKQRHWRSCLSLWDLHPLPSPKCGSTPHTYTKSIPPMADVHHGSRK